MAKDGDRSGQASALASGAPVPRTYLVGDDGGEGRDEQGVEEAGGDDPDAAIHDLDPADGHHGVAVPDGEQGLQAVTGQAGRES